jgi:ectoine hydroxylase-related dioxygenase (phytanoyl-CoA dioxygenase family)
MSNPDVSALVRSEALVQLAGEWLGGSAVPFRATLFEKTPGANWLIPWHQDTALPLARRFDAPGWGPWSEKSGVTYAHAPAWALLRVIALRVHLDRSGADNGPLRVIPGSHEAGVLSDREVSRWVSSVEPVSCLGSRGGVVVMRPLVIHASSKVLSDAPRRVLHIEYADSLGLADGIRLALA